MKAGIFTKSTAITAVFWLSLILAPQAHAVGWQIMPTGTTSTLTGIWVNAPADIFAVGTDGTILHYDGTAWHPMTSGVTESLYAVWGTSGSDVYAVGTNGTILHYNGISWSPVLRYDGISWSPLPPEIGRTFFSIWGSTLDSIFIATSTNKMLHYTWAAWADELASTGGSFFGIWGSSSFNVFAVGSSGRIVNYDGSLWAPFTSGTTANLQSICGTAGSDVYAVGGNGTILHYDGVRWSAMASPTTRNLYSVWCAGSDVFAAGEEGTILRCRDGAWSAMFTGMINTFFAIAGTSATDFYVCGDNGIMLHYTGPLPLCPFSRVAGAGSAKVASLRQLRDDRLATALGALIATMYYQNVGEISDILESDAGLRSRFGRIVMGALPDVKALVSTGSGSISSDKLFEMHEFLTDLQDKAGPKLQMDIDLILRGIESGWLTALLGVIVE